MCSFWEQEFLIEYQFNELFIEAYYVENHDQVKRIRELICHIINVHHLWISRILGEEPENEDWDDLPFHAWSQLNKENYQQSLLSLKQLDLHQNIKYTTSDGLIMEKTLVQLLSHIIHHGTYHRGQINTLLTQNGLIPIACNRIEFNEVSY